MNHIDANRCLLCKKAKCTVACPVYTDVPQAIRLYKEGRLEEAGKLLFDNNPFSGITCQVCDWNRMCYGSCILNVKKAPIHWYEMEQEISMSYLENFHPSAPDIELDKKVAIIGGGPAGITAAIKLREKGIQVTIFDNHERLGGVLRYGIPTFRLNPKYYDELERIVKETKANFIGKCIVGKDISIKNLRTEYDAVFLASGAWKPRKLHVPGEDNENVIYALEFLEAPQDYRLGNKVLVIGGGNVTMDASRTALRQGKDTWVYYRKDFENMPANVTEIEEAREEGVKFVVFEVPVGIRKDGDRNFAIMRKCKNITDENGRVATQMIEGTDYEVEFDTMIVAISENVDYGILGDETPALDSHGWIEVNEYQQTSFPDLFIAGDFLTGPKTVVEAVESAKTAVKGITNFLGIE